MGEIIKIVDMHCDTIVKCKRKGFDLFENSMQVDLKRMKEVVSVQDFAIWLEKEYYPVAYKETCECIDFYYSQLEKNKDFICHVNTYDEILNARESGEIASILSIEGGEAIEGSIEKLKYFYDKGVRLMTLTWNYKNEIGGGAGFQDLGLTEFGKEVLKTMESLGMIVDVSHLSDKGFYDVLSIASKPFIASHSNSRAICNCKRNLTDDQIREIKNIGGVIGINLYRDFVSLNKECGIDDVMKHIDHIINVGSDEVLGFGCDYDGIDATPDGLFDVSSVYKIVDEIEKRYGRETAEKIAWRNFDRIYSDIL